MLAIIPGGAWGVDRVLILRYAAYQPRICARRTQRVVFAANDFSLERGPVPRPSIAGLYLGTDPLPASTKRVTSVAFQMRAADQGWASAGGEGQLPRPRFNAPGLNLEFLRNPSWKMRVWYYLFPLFVFGHIPLQTFFDFNAVFILLS